MKEKAGMMTTDSMFKHPEEHQTKKKLKSWVCDHCKGKGHIRSYCFKLHGESKYFQQKPYQKGWNPKSINTGLIAHTSFRASSKEDWYFDSGCSRHMSGVENYLEDVKPYVTSYVTFGDGAKGKIVRIGNLIKHGLPRLDDVLRVKGLTANLISISQLCDLGLQVNFTKPECQISDEKGEVLMRGTRSKDNCYLWVSQEESFISSCLLSKEEEIKLWHQRLGHLHLKGIKKAITSEAIRGLPDLKIVEGSICGECQIGKQTRMSHPRLEHQATSKVLELLHMDLMVPMQVESTGGKRYVLVVVDDFSRFTWVNFIREKSNTFDVFKELCTQLQREKGYAIVRIRSDHGTEFETAKFDEYCSDEGIKHEFSSPITPQQNGVVERKNMTLQEFAKVMLHAKHLPYRFWAEAMNTTCHIHNRVTLRSGTTTTLYEFWKGRKPTVKYFHVFGSKCYILSDRDYRRKMDSKSDAGIFLGYSTNNRAYRVFNSKTETVMVSINVVIDDVPKERVPDVDADVETPVQETNAPTQVNESEPEKDENEDTGQDQMSTTKGPSIRIQMNHPQRNALFLLKR